MKHVSLFWAVGGLAEKSHVSFPPPPIRQLKHVSFFSFPLLTEMFLFAYNI